MTEEEQRQMAFEQYPIGTYLLSEHYFGIHKVTGWLVGTWNSTTRPWYCLACENVAGQPRSESALVSDKRWDELASRIVKGAMPESKAVLRQHVLNGGGARSFCKLHDVKMVINNWTTIFTWGHHGHWLVLEEDYGDPSVGMGGEFHRAYSYEGSYPCDYEKDESGYFDVPTEENKWLLHIAFWLKRYKEENDPYWTQCILADRAERVAYKANVQIPRSADLKGMWRKNYYLVPHSFTSICLLKSDPDAWESLDDPILL